MLTAFGIGIVVVLGVIDFAVVFVVVVVVSVVVAVVSVVVAAVVVFGVFDFVATVGIVFVAVTSRLLLLPLVKILLIQPRQADSYVGGEAWRFCNFRVGRHKKKKL